MAFYRRNLPHLQRDFKAHFITFVTKNRWMLPDWAREIALDCCRHDYGRKFDLHVAVVMPDHVHIIFTPLIDEQRQLVVSLAEIMKGIKGTSAHTINRRLDRHGTIWQEESFDHVLRSSESLDHRVTYVLENPVRRGLVSSWHDYPWLWHQPFPNPYAPQQPTWPQTPSSGEACETRQGFAGAMDSCGASPRRAGEGTCPYASKC